MKKIKKITVMLTLFTLALLLLVGCVAPSPAETDTTSADTSETTTEPGGSENDSINIATSGSSGYKLVRPEKCSQAVIDAMQALNKAIEKKYNILLSTADDWVKGLERGAFYESDEPELLVGKTNRKESNEIYSSLARGEYKTAVVGNKLVIVGYNDYLTALAVEEFIKSVVDKSSESLSVPANYSFVGKSKSDLIGDTDATMRVMTFNILGSGSEPNKRNPYIINIVDTYQPGVVCFQECNKAQHEAVVNNLNGYGVATQKHSNGTTYDYTPIAYRTDLYRVIKAGVEWNRMRYEKTNTKCTSWAVFEELQSGDFFAVVNIHGSLWTKDYDLPAGKTYEDMRALAVTWRDDNVRQMHDISERIISEYGQLPIVWTGDFNFNADASAYKIATNECGMLDAEQTATEAKNISATLHTVGQAPSATGKSIDHIFGNENVIFRVHHVCKSGDELKASDHCAVFADLKFATSETNTSAQ